MVLPDLWERVATGIDKPRRDYQYEKHKDGIIRKKYGIGLDDAQKKLEAQNFICPICLGRLDDMIGRNAQIEHDHKTGRFRGIVCLRCNLGLGWIQDNPEIVSRIVAYLAQY